MVGPEFGIPESGGVWSLDGVPDGDTAQGKDFSEAISNTVRPPAVVLNFRRNEELDLTGVWG